MLNTFLFSLKDVACGFVSEALAGRHTTVHTIYYEVEDEDGLVSIPGKYADRGETANYLRQMAHTVNGRFHWYRNGGEYFFLLATVPFRYQIMKNQ